MGKTSNKAAALAVNADPIFARIEAHRAAKQEYANTCSYDDEFPDEVTREPRVAYGTYNDLQGNRTPHYLRSGKEIDGEIKSLRAINGNGKFMREARKALRERLLTGLRADAVALKKAQDKSGYTAAARAYDAASIAGDRAYDALLRTAPTTPAGMAALANYIAETECIWLDKEERSASFRALKMLAKCALRMKG